MRRKVLVTGANSGIGLATALELAGRGFHTFGSCRTEEGAATIREAAARAGVEVETVNFDLAVPSTYEGVVEDLSPWGLVNNAAVTNAGAFEDVPVELARSQLETMVVAPVALSLAALPEMRRRGSGRIVNVVSVSVGSGVPLLGWYQAAKAAVDAVTRAMHAEFLSSGVDVIAVDPGMVDTPIWDKARRELEGRYRGSWLRPSYERALDLIARLRPVRASPETVARTVGRALTIGKPATRYPAGVDAHLFNTGLRLLPRRAVNRAVRMTSRS